MSEEINVTSQEVEVTEENENEAVQIKLTRSEQREQVFMLLFSKSFTNTSVDNMVQDSSELFMGGVSALAQAEVEGIVSAKEELDEIISRYLKKGWTLSRISKPSLEVKRRKSAGFWRLSRCL